MQCGPRETEGLEPGFAYGSPPRQLPTQPSPLHSLGQSAFVPKDCVRNRSHVENMTHTRLTEQRREAERALADARRLVT